MARIPLHMPKFGMTMTEGTIVEWAHEVGDQIKKGDVLLSVETEKVVTDIESPADGTLAARLFDVEADVPVGEIIAYIEE